jgi:hypothetical protein
MNDGRLAPIAGERFQHRECGLLSRVFDLGVARAEHAPHNPQNLRADDGYQRPDCRPLAPLSAAGELSKLIMAILEPTRARGAEKAKHDLVVS